MNPVRTKTAVCFSLLLLGSLTACGQVGYRARSPGLLGDGYARAPAPTQEPGPASTQAPEGERAVGRDAPTRGRPYGQTRARLTYFREDIELEELHVDFDSGPDATFHDSDRDRYGFRAEFGRPESSGFFQLFAEDLRAPALLGEEFHDYGIGGGVVGTPTVGEDGPLEFVVPYRFEVDLVRGSESVGGFDAELYYLEGIFELGFGARRFGVQASSGVILQSLAGRFDSDDPASPSRSGSAVTGTNVGGYLELLYKNDRVPLLVRVRGIVGDVSGLQFSFGFAF